MLVVNTFYYLLSAFKVSNHRKFECLDATTHECFI